MPSNIYIKHVALQKLLHIFLSAIKYYELIQTQGRDIVLELINCIIHWCFPIKSAKATNQNNCSQLGSKGAIIVP